MATGLKSFGPADTKRPEYTSQRDNQLARDRVTGVIVLVVMFILMALMIWLASMGEGTQNLDYYDYPMMY